MRRLQNVARPTEVEPLALILLWDDNLICQEYPVCD